MLDGIDHSYDPYRDAPVQSGRPGPEGAGQFIVPKQHQAGGLLASMAGERSLLTRLAHYVAVGSAVELPADSALARGRLVTDMTFHLGAPPPCFS